MLYRSDSKKTQNTAKWVSFALISIVDLNVHFNRSSLGIIGEYIMEDLPMSSTTFGTLSAMFTYAYMIMLIPVGSLIDRFGTRRVIACGCFLAAAGEMLFGTAETIAQIYIGRALIGAGLSVPAIALQKFVMNWFDEKRASTVIGLGAGLGSMGALAAQFPLALCLTLTSWRLVVLSAAAVCVATGSARLLLLRDSPTDPARLHANTQSSGQQSLSFRDILRIIRNTFANKYLWPIFIVIAIQTGLNQIFASTWAVPFLCSSFGLTNAQASAYTTCMMVGMILVATCIGGISDFLKSRKKVFAALCCIQGASWVLITFAARTIFSTGILWPIMFLLGGGGCAAQLGYAYARDVTDPRYVGITISCISTVNMLFAAMAPTVCGIMMDFHIHAGKAGLALYRSAFIPLAAAALVCIPVILLFTRETGCQNCYDQLFPRENSHG